MIVNSAVRTRLFRLPGSLVSASVMTVAAVLFVSSAAHGASWQWSSGAGGRERVVVRLDPGMREQGTVRTTPTSVDIQLSGSADALAREGGAPSGALVSNVDSQNNVIRLSLNDPAFGYIVQRQGDSITLEIFPDPLGARWQPSDSRTVLPPAPVPPTTAPVAVPPSASTASQATPPATPASPTGQGTGGVPGENAAPVNPAEAASSGQTGVATQPPAQTPTPMAPDRTGTSATTTTEPPASSSQGAAPSTPPSSPPSVSVPGEPAGSEGSAPLTDTRSAVSGDVQESVTAPPASQRGSQSPTAEPQVATVRTPEGQGQIIVPPTSGRDVRVNIQVDQPAQAAPTGASTPAGMPGSQPGSQAPLAVSSGTSLPVQPDPPSDILPSPDTLGTITQRIESLPVQQEQSGQNQHNTGGLLSTPTAPPPTQVEINLGAPVQEGASAQPVQENSAVVVDQPGMAAGVDPGNVSVDINANAAPPATPSGTFSPDVNVQGIAPQSLQPENPSLDVTTNQQTPAPVQSPRVVAESGSSLRARINPGGPESWPQAEAISSIPSTSPTTALPPTGTEAVVTPPASRTETIVVPPSANTETVVIPPSASTETMVIPPASSTETVVLPPEVTGTIETVTQTPATSPGDAHAAEGGAVQEPEVIYVDEEGNPVPKPIDVNAKMAEARQLIQSMEYDAALAILEEVKTAPLPPEKREEVLYLISDATTGLYNGKWLEGYEPIVATTSEAMNANLRSPQVARALERLGMINLRTGNQQDAAGYFGVLRRQFPYDPQVPEVYYALGQDQLNKGQYAEAVQNFQLVMQEYPESQAVRPASRYMAEALYKQGHYERAMTIIDFVDRRWPRIYIDDPSYLFMVADTQFRRGRLDDALQTYWIYYNLLPNSPTNDQLLLNMGTIYLMLGDKETSNALYSELLRRYPDSQYAPLAVLRQGEEGIFEGNLSVDELFAMFFRPNMTTLPEVAYHRLLNEYPDSEEAITAKLRMAAWKLWNREYIDAMNFAERFVQEHPDSMYAPRADEILLRAIAIELAMDLEEQNYDRILSRWERFPQMRGAYANMDDELRIALARAHINRGNETEGFALLEPFLERGQDPKYGEYVYKLSLARALRNEDWQGIIDLGKKVEQWNLPQDEKNQLIYAMAIARENMNQTQEAVPLWDQLYKRNDIPLYQKAYANYFMARDAERRRNINEAYEMNKSTLELFQRLAVENPERADTARVQETLVALMDVTEVANRFAEALHWADEYASFVPETSSEFAAYRFRLARLHRKMGDLLRWQYYLEDIIEREPNSVFGQMAASELRTHQVARDLTRFSPDS